MRETMLALLLALLLSACGGHVTGYQLASVPQSAGPGNLPPISFPRDEAPHDVLTEWWYYTGHLYSGGRSYGFELVTFQVNRGRMPTTYLAHFAVADPNTQQFKFEQRTQTGRQSQPKEGFELSVGGWEMRGLNGHDHLEAAMPGYAINLDLVSAKPPVLHNGNGIISFGPAGSSYYYSRTRMDVRGTLTDHGKALPVTGLAWMDHQWGNFISLVGGGWDWFSVQLADRTDLTVSVVRDPSGRKVLTYGTYVHPDGRYDHVTAGEIQVTATGSWTSPATRATYPSGWRLRIPDRGVDLTITPVLRDQELVTTGTTGVEYWEGAVTISGTDGGRAVAGVGYVELTGYSR